MLDADSLLRGALSSELPPRIEIGVVRAPNEPLWHQYLAGLTVFRQSAPAMAFLRDLSTFIVSNLLGARVRPYLDQIGLYAAMYEHAAAATELPIDRFCDTLLRDAGLVWSVTQQKDAGPYNAYKEALLNKYQRTASS
jgi:hypothetical protein